MLETSDQFISHHFPADRLAKLDAKTLQLVAGGEIGGKKQRSLR